MRDAIWTVCLGLGARLLAVTFLGCSGVPVNTCDVGTVGGNHGSTNCGKPAGGGTAKGGASSSVASGGAGATSSGVASGGASAGGVSSISCVDYPTLLDGTLNSMLAFVDPRTGLLHDHRALANSGNREVAGGGIIPQLANWDFSTVSPSGITVQLVEGEPGYTLDYGLRITYEKAQPAAFGYYAIHAGLDLQALPPIKLAVRARADSFAVLEIKFECANGVQQIFDATFGRDFAWYEFPWPTDGGCDFAQVDNLTFSSTDDKMGAVDVATWEIDHLALEVDPEELATASNTATDCSGTYVPLPCRSLPTSVDNVGYELAALAAARCSGRAVNVPGFDSVELALLQALTTIEAWPKWNGEGPQGVWGGKQGFPWTWFDASTGLPPSDQLLVFALDQAHLDAGLRIVEQAAASTACNFDTDLRATVGAKARALREGMNWSLLMNGSDQALGWHARPQTGDLPNGLFGNEQARGNEALLRDFLSVASGATTPDLFARLSCDVTTDGEGHTWYRTFTEAADPKTCVASFVQQVPALFVDLSQLPTSPNLQPTNHAESVKQLMLMQGLDTDGMHGRSDCLLPDGSQYVTSCSIPSTVVTPQSALLGLEFVASADQGVCAFHSAGADRLYTLGNRQFNRGMRDSFDTGAGTVGEAVFLPLDQARLVLALLNHLNADFAGSSLPIVRALFAQDGSVQAAYATLHTMSVCN